MDAHEGEALEVDMQLASEPILNGDTQTIALSMPGQAVGARFADAPERRTGFHLDSGKPVNPTAVDQPEVLPTRRGYHVLKRIVDICFCLFTVPLLSPLLALLSILIILNSPGPLFFSQERVGKGGRRFRMYKFRTMPRHADDSGDKEFMQAFVRGKVCSRAAEEPIYKPPQELQTTQPGRILPMSSLDELPQLFNVLKGEMSLVGPRPNVPWEVAAYQPWHHRRLEALPGITGLAQVRGRSRISFDSIVRHDIEYLEKQSLLLDFKIILWTVPCVLSVEGIG